MFTAPLATQPEAGLSKVVLKTSGVEASQRITHDDVALVDVATAYSGVVNDSVVVDQDLPLDAPTAPKKRLRKWADMNQLNSKSRSTRLPEVIRVSAPKAESEAEANIDILRMFCVLKQHQKKLYKKVFGAYDVDGCGLINLEQTVSGLMSANENVLGIKEVDFVIRVLESFNSHGGNSKNSEKRPMIDFETFAIMAAMSEKVQALDISIRTHIDQIDFMLLEKQVARAKELFQLYSHDGVSIDREQLKLMLNAGRVLEYDIALSLLPPDGARVLKLIDYLTYIPLFANIHKDIWDNPLKSYTERRSLIAETVSEEYQEEKIELSDPSR